MTRKEIYERLNEVFRETFDDEDIAVNDETTAADVDGWDSYEHISLVFAVESAFGMKFTMGEIHTMRNVGAMVDIIEARGE
jgi:acyl carrier protein